MNSKNSKTSNPHRLSLNLICKINLKRSDKMLSIKKIYKNNVQNISSNME